MLVEFGRVNRKVVASHLVEDLPVHFPWHLDGGVTRIYETDSSSDPLGHILAIISDFVHQQAPFAYGEIIVVVQTGDSANDLIVIDLAKRNF